MPSSPRLKALDDALQEGRARPNDREERLRLEHEAYRSSHWDEPNVLAHVRFNDRTGPNGEKILFIEELQSDWHQKGRKEGYKTGTTSANITKTEPATGENAAIWENIYTFDDGVTVGANSEREAIAEHGFEVINKNKVPDAPWKKTWPLKSFQRMVRYAAENGYDSISWTPGEVQADRYDLSKQVDALKWDGDEKSSYLSFVGLKGVSDQTLEISIDRKSGNVKTVDIGAPTEWEGKHLSDIIGKDISEKILSDQKGELKEEGLKIGGEGMKGFYNKILPAEINKFFNKAKWGKAKVGVTEIGGKGVSYLYDGNRRLSGPYETREEAGRDNQESYGGEATVTTTRDEQEGFETKEVWTLPITPEMKQKAMGEGFWSSQANQPNALKRA